MSVANVLATENLTTTVNTLEIPQPRAGFDRLVNHYLEREVSPDSDEWQRHMAAHAASIQPVETPQPTLLQRVVQFFANVNPIREVWDKQWRQNLRLNEHYFSLSLAASDYEWDSRCLKLRNPGSTLTRILLIANAIKKLQPQSVVEVGCGDGLNLFFLASLFPKISFTGIELTRGGVETAKNFQQQLALPNYMAEHFDNWNVDRQAFKKIQFRQGSATNLLLATSSIDMVMSCVALEQMEAIRDKALSEVARVARRWTALLEPFQEFNTTDMKRAYIKTYNYFAGSIEDLPRYGLEPGFVCEDIPQKPKENSGLVVSCKT